MWIDYSDVDDHVCWPWVIVQFSLMPFYLAGLLFVVAVHVAKVGFFVVRDWASRTMGGRAK
jgi:hypothetical protein